MLTDFMRLFVGRETDFARQSEDGSWRPMRRPLTWEDYAAHIDQHFTYGVYLGRESDSRVRLLCFDFDSGESAWADATRVIEAMRGIVPEQATLYEFSGRKGYHVWVFFEEWQDCNTVRRFGLQVMNNAGVTCEVYPKGPVPDGGYGTLVKLPLALHRVSGKSSAIIGPKDSYAELLNPAAILASRRPLSGADSEALFSFLPPEPVVERAEYQADGSLLPCAQSILENGQGKGARNHAMYSFGVAARRAGLDKDEALALALQANEKFSPPIRRQSLVKTLAGSYVGGTGFDCTREFLHEAPRPHCLASCPRYKEAFGRARQEEPSEEESHARAGAGDDVRDTWRNWGGGFFGS